MAEIFRDKKLQRDVDLMQIEALTNYISTTVCSEFNKLDNFPKYVQQTAIGRFLARFEVFKAQLEVPGCILDLGVGRGASLFSWAHFSSIFEPVNYTREIIGFDTFEGCPDVDENDTNSHSSLVRKGGFKVEDGMYEDIQKGIEVFDINRPLNHLEKVKVVKGDICDTLPKFVEETPHLMVSLLHLDTDLYRPTKTALSLLCDRMPSGAVIAFDEINNKFYPGETVATLETIGVKGLKLRRFPWATTISYAIVE